MLYNKPNQKGHTHLTNIYINLGAFIIASYTALEYIILNNLFIKHTAKLLYSHKITLSQHKLIKTLHHHHHRTIEQGTLSHFSTGISIHPHKHTSKP